MEEGREGETDDVEGQEENNRKVPEPENQEEWSRRRRKGKTKIGGRRGERGP
jgi:hypothetical protein